LIGRQHRIQLIISDKAALLGGLDHLFDRFATARAFAFFCFSGLQLCSDYWPSAARRLRLAKAEKPLFSSTRTIRKCDSAVVNKFSVFSAAFCAIFRTKRR
jgi:hypothetical protein